MKVKETPPADTVQKNKEAAKLKDPSGSNDAEIIQVRRVRQVPRWETLLFALLCLIAIAAAFYLRTHTPQPPALEQLSPPSPSGKR